MHDDEIRSILKFLGAEYQTACLQWDTYKGVSARLQRDAKVAGLANTFWYTVTSALVTGTALSLTRLFDGEQSSVHLQKLLCAFKASPELLTTEAFIERHQGNPHLDSLLESRGDVSIADVEQDLASCEHSDPLVKKLIRYRGSRLAHLGFTLHIRRPSSEDGLEESELAELIDRSGRIINSYSYAMFASRYVRNSIGARDYHRIFDTLSSAPSHR
jgi:hypothetical protein